MCHSSVGGFLPFWFFVISVMNLMFMFSFGAFYYATTASIYCRVLNSFFSLHPPTIHKLFTKTRQSTINTLFLDEESDAAAMMKNFRIYSSIFSRSRFRLCAIQFTIIFDGTMDQHTNLQSIQTAQGLCFTLFCCISASRRRYSLTHTSPFVDIPCQALTPRYIHFLFVHSLASNSIGALARVYTHVIRGMSASGKRSDAKTCNSHNRQVFSSLVRCWCCIPHKVLYEEKRNKWIYGIRKTMQCNDTTQKWAIPHNFNNVIKYHYIFAVKDSEFGKKNGEQERDRVEKSINMPISLYHFWHRKSLFCGCQQLAAKILLA